jgi:hypothetical protein
MLGFGPEPEIASVVLRILRETPLSVILDATNHTYREGWLVQNAGDPWWVSSFRPTGPRVLVVDINPATDEAPHA